MNVDDRLLYEARTRPRLAVVAGLAGLLLIVGAITQLSGPHTKVDELTVDLIIANKRFPLDLIASVLNALGSLALAWALWWLYGASRARNPEQKSFISTLVIVGGVLAALTGVVYAVWVAIKVHQFVTTGTQTYDEANHLTTTPGLLALQLVGQLAALLVAVAFVLVALNAMRVGLLTRFMGYLGIFGGILVLFQITQVPVIQAYWLFALAYLLSGRWPSGVPPAWRSGRAEPWPSSQQMRAQRAGAAPRGGRGKGAPTPAPVGGPAPSPSPGRSRSSSAKRKRKRRG